MKYLTILFLTIIILNILLTSHGRVMTRSEKRKKDVYTRGKKEKRDITKKKSDGTIIRKRIVRTTFERDVSKSHKKNNKKDKRPRRSIPYNGSN
uniref:Uncharacterized protein n=1 Tax=Strongyloides stercoralis TaxID=6248 RepID=A0A0K0E6C4_STRER